MWTSARPVQIARSIFISFFLIDYTPQTLYT